jgi:hypothetical protein
MPKVDFTKVNEAGEYQPIDEGEYLAEVINVDVRQGQKGEYWNIKYQILTGDNAGKHVYDNLSFAPGALKRVKLFCSRLGLDVSGELDLSPGDIQNGRIKITLEISEYDGKLKNIIPFEGFDRATEEEIKAINLSNNDDIPF